MLKIGEYMSRDLSNSSRLLANALFQVMDGGRIIIHVGISFQKTPQEILVGLELWTLSVGYFRYPSLQKFAVASPLVHGRRG
jgi:hypothetical protein